MRPFPQFNSVTDQNERDGNTWYDALQIKVTKRLGNGLSGGLGYSWSKDLGTVSSTGTYTAAIPIQDPTLPPKSQKSYLAIDQPQMLNFYFNYEVPRFRFAQSGWKRAVFTGWTTDGIFHYQSGFPIQTPSSTSTLTSVTFANGVWANRVPGQKLFLHSLNDHNVNPRTTFFLNPAAWANPAPGTYATSKPYYGDFRGPRYPSEQLGFGKVIHGQGGGEILAPRGFLQCLQPLGISRPKYGESFRDSSIWGQRKHCQRLRFPGGQHLRRRRKLCSEKYLDCRENPVLSVTSANIPTNRPDEFIWPVNLYFVNTGSEDFFQLADAVVGINGEASLKLHNIVRNANHWIGLSLTRLEVGAKITWSASGVAHGVFKEGDGSYLSSCDPSDVLGSEAAEYVDWIQVQWPATIRCINRFEHVRAGKYYYLTSGGKLL